MIPKFVLKHDKLGCFFRVNNGVLEYQPQWSTPKENYPRRDDWIEVDMTRGGDDYEMAEVRWVQEYMGATK